MATAAPSRKPGFWAEVERLNRAGTKAAKEEAPAPVPAKKAAAKAKGRAKRG